MANLSDAEILTAMGIKTPEPKLDKKQTVVAAESFDLIKGNLAQALSPSIEKDESDEDILAAMNGKPTGMAMVIQDAKLMESILPKDLEQRQMMADMGFPESLKVRARLSKTGAKLVQRFGEAGKTLLTTLSADEHSIVWGLNKTLGRKETKDFSDNNWTNFLLESGMDNDAATMAMGLSMSVFLSPFTYLTGGATAAGRIGLKTALSRQGVRLMNNITKKRAENIMAKKSVELGRNLKSAEKTKIANAEKLNVQREIIRFFGEINDANRHISIGTDVKKIPGRARVSGALRFELPGFLGGAAAFDSGNLVFKGKTLLEGIKASSIMSKTITPIIKSSKIPEIADDANKLINTSYKIDNRKVQVFRNWGDKGAELLKMDKMTISEEASTHGAYVSAMILEGEKTLRIQNREITKRVNFFFNKRLTKSQQKEFMQTMVDASEESRKLLDEALETFAPKEGSLSFARQIGARDEIPVQQIINQIRQTIKVESKDPVVQNILDFYTGRGKFKGRKSVMEKMAKSSRLLTGTELPIHIPGILDEITSVSLKLPNKITKEADRLFLSERSKSGEFVKMYTKDPKQALIIRQTQLAKAAIHDEIFKKVKETGVGTTKYNVIAKAKNLNQKEIELLAAKDGFVMLRNPIDEDLIASGQIATKRLKEETLWVEKEFKAAFNRAITTNNTPVKFISPFLESSFVQWPTRLWKARVTSIFPSFHFGNFISNQVINSLRIGLHNFSPRKQMIALAVNMKIGIKRRKTGAAVTIADRIYDTNANMILGANPFKKVKTAIGEELTIDDFAQEAFEHGVVDKTFFQQDILGAMKSTDLAEGFAVNLNRYANPFSKEWKPIVFGARFGQAVEAQARMVNFVTHRIKGLNARTAAVEVNDALFDYGDLTRFEKSINSSLIPFYTFSKKNLGSHLQLLKTDPGRILNTLKLFRDVGPTEDELRNMPEYARRKLIFRINNELYNSFKIPIEDIIELVGDDPTQRLNPFLQYGLTTLYLKRDPFTGRELDAVNNADEFRPLLRWIKNKNIPDVIKDKLFRPIKNYLKLEVDERGKVIGDPNVLWLLRHSPASRFMSEAARLQKKDKNGFDKTLRFMFGVIRIDPDIELQEALMLRKAQKALGSDVARTNAGRKIDIPGFVGPESDLVNQLNNELTNHAGGKDLEQQIKWNKNLLEKLQKQRVGR